MTPAKEWHALVVGIGNPERGDDGVGAEVARLVADRRPAGVKVTHYREPVKLLDEPFDDDIVVVVDAMSSGAVAGSIAVREVADDPMPGWASASGTHAVGLDAVVELARVLGRLPKRLVVVGVEAGTFETGSDLSAAVRVGAQEAANTVLALVQESR